MKLPNLNYPFLFIIFLTLSLFTCENNEDISQSEENNNPDLMLTMSELMNRFDVNGNADESQNPSGNMALEFCFEFVFPIDFQMNNSTIFTINSLDELVDVLIESDEDSYIVDIVYPFDILVFNHETDTIEIMTIQNDDAFSNLIDNCEFDLDEDDYCYEIYDPVCVEITNAHGESIVLVYPNDCYAGLDGFDENDFLEECDFEDDHDDDWFDDDWFEDDWFGYDCFDLVYPITLANSNGDVVTINSEEGLLEYIEEWYLENCNNVEDCEFDFEVVFPITVEYYSEHNQQTQTLVINSEEELDEYVEEYCDFEDDHDDDWFEDDWFGNDCFDLIYPINLANSNGDVVTIYSEEGLLEYIEEWYLENCNNVEDCEFDFEVVFPITVEYYSENNQQTQTLVINSEEELDEYVEEYCD